MAIQNHPQFGAFSKALDDLNAAKKSLDEAKATKQTPAVIQSLLEKWALAQVTYDRIARELTA